MVEQNRIPGKESMVKIAAIQMEPKIGYKEENVKKTIEKINEAIDNGANFIVLPELCNTGYMFNTREEVYSVAEQVPEGPTTQAWLKIAQEKKVYICAGITEVEKDGVRCFNSAVLLGPDGYIGKHRKMHLWADDKLFFEPGDLGYQVFETPIGRIGILICFDMWFFENFRILGQMGADIICIPTNWVDTPPEEMHTIGTRLAVVNSSCNSLYTVCADRVGVERGCKFPGMSCITGPEGWFRAGPASVEGEEIIYAECNILDARRVVWNPLNVVYRDRRTDLYDEMLGTDYKPLAR